jgi:hypothetical protein
MLRPFVYKKLIEYSQKTVAKARAKLRAKPLSASSDLLKSIQFEITPKGNYAKVEFSFLAYGEYVDRGRRKGATPPPIKPIQDWIKKKGLDLNAYAIAKSISKKGIKPYPWIEEVFPDDSKPNLKPSLELEALWEELLVYQIEYDIDMIEE